MTTSTTSNMPTPCPRRDPFQFEPMPAPGGPLLFLETLLKHPGRVIHELHGHARRRLARRRDATLDRAGEARAGHLALGSDLFAKSLHLQLFGRERGASRDRGGSRRGPRVGRGGDDGGSRSDVGPPQPRSQGKGAPTEVIALTVWPDMAEVRVRFQDGATRVLRTPTPSRWRVGDHVRAEGGRLVAD